MPSVLRPRGALTFDRGDDGEVQSIYWSGYLVLWQAESINQEGSFALTYSRHISALQDTRSQCYPAKFDQQMQFPCAAAISDEDVIMWNWAKW